MVSDITNPKMYINHTPGNTQSMLRKGRVVVVEHICEFHMPYSNTNVTVGILQQFPH